MPTIRHENTGGYGYFPGMATPTIGEPRDLANWLGADQQAGNCILERKFSYRQGLAAL